MIFDVFFDVAPFRCWPLPCPSFPWFFCFTNENLEIYQGFSFPAECIQALEKEENAHFSKEIPC